MAAADEPPSTGLGVGEEGAVRAGMEGPDVAPEDWSARPRRKWLRWTLAAVALAAVGAWALVAGSRLGKDATQVQSPLLGKPAPAFELPLLGGGIIDSADLLGQAYVVNFWASWCVPCREEAPALQAFHGRWSDRGVRLLGVVYQDAESKAEEFRDEFGLTFPQAMDPDGTTAIDFGVFGIPETYVVDERGIVMAKLIGAVGPTTLDDVLAQIRSGQTVTDRNERYRTSPDDP